MFFFDPLYLLIMAPAFLIMLATQWYVNSAYNRWSKVQARSGMTGAQVAQRLIEAGGLYDVDIEMVGGRLSDHYDPRNKKLRLSQGVAQSTSVAATAIAAHELGHAMQDHQDYVPLRFRAGLVPVVNIGSSIGWILIFGGLLFGLTDLAWVGLAFFSAGAIFALVTLPVELNASARARRLLSNAGIINSGEEERGVSNVLNAAALTYVAALISSLLQVLYFALRIAGGSRRR